MNDLTPKDFHAQAVSVCIAAEDYRLAAPWTANKKETARGEPRDFRASIYSAAGTTIGKLDTSSDMHHYTSEVIVAAAKGQAPHGGQLSIFPPYILGTWDYRLISKTGQFEIFDADSKMLIFTSDAMLFHRKPKEAMEQFAKQLVEKCNRTLESYRAAYRRQLTAATPGRKKPLHLRIVPNP